MDIFSIFLNMKDSLCVLLRIALSVCSYGIFLLGTQERVQNSRG